MSITTGRGEDGDTDLLFGRRIAKGDRRIEVGGSIDELNAFIGLVRAGGATQPVVEILNTIQKNLVAIMGEVARLQEDAEHYLAKGYSRITAADKDWLVSEIKQIESGERKIEFRGWARPGAAGVMGAAYLDVCRAVCRRSERLFWLWDVEKNYQLHIQQRPR